jgi:hypothetical protein
MKLEIKHLAPYLPYGLKMYNVEQKTIHELTIAHQTFDTKSVGMYPLLKNDFISTFKPILHPLSDILKSCNSFLDFGSYNNEFREEFVQDIKFKTNSYLSMVFLLEMQFDVFNLIENGLAIDVNTLEVNPYS